MMELKKLVDSYQKQIKDIESELEVHIFQNEPT